MIESGSPAGNDDTAETGLAGFWQFCLSPFRNMPYVMSQTIRTRYHMTQWRRDPVVEVVACLHRISLFLTCLSSACFCCSPKPETESSQDTPGSHTTLYPPAQCVVRLFRPFVLPVACQHGRSLVGNRAPCPSLAVGVSVYVLPPRANTPLISPPPYSRRCIFGTSRSLSFRPSSLRAPGTLIRAPARHRRV